MQPSADVLRLGVISLFVNIILMVVKIVVGWVGNSYALIADGIESASDIFTSIITWTGFKLSLRPADQDHPFGHGKIEALAGLFSGGCLLLAAGFIAWHSVLEIRTPHHAPAWFTLPVLLVIVAVKETLSRTVLAAGEELQSMAIQGDAWHHRSDAITSAAAAVGIAIALIGGPGFESADDWGALAACGVIVINGGFIVRASLHDMLDGRVADELGEAVVAVARLVDGVEGIEKCRVRKSGVGLFVEIHVEVDPDMTVAEGHSVGHLVKDALIAEPKLRILDAVVHLEPASR
jgi:cation diffusion facilitator family transporter